jgi:hypothetical protein
MPVAQKGYETACFIGDTPISSYYRLIPLLAISGVPGHHRKLPSVGQNLSDWSGMMKKVR